MTKVENKPVRCGVTRADNHCAHCAYGVMFFECCPVCYPNNHAAREHKLDTSGNRGRYPWVRSEHGDA